MLGRKSAFGALVKADAPHITVTHCALHRHALATKPSLQNWQKYKQLWWNVGTMCETVL